MLGQQHSRAGSVAVFGGVRWRRDAGWSAGMARARAQSNVGPVTCCEDRTGDESRG